MRCEEKPPTPALSPPYVLTVGSRCVAAAILAAVEGGILPPGPEVRNGSDFRKPHAHSAGQDALLYGRQDACRYAKQILRVRGPVQIERREDGGRPETRRAGDGAAACGRIWTARCAPKPTVIQEGIRA